MDGQASGPPTLLLVEDDPGIRETVELLLCDEGYSVRSASDPREALKLVDAHAFRLVVTDLFRTQGRDPLDAAELLKERAHPTPVALMTAWRVEAADVRQRGFCALLAKPFELDRFLSDIAACLDSPLDAQEQLQAEVVQRYFAALTAKDWDALVDLCSDDVTYELPGFGVFSHTVTGKEVFRTFSEQTFHTFPDSRFEDVSVYATPHGLAARYLGRWHTPDGAEVQQSGTVVFTFVGERIAQIGIRVNAERLEKITRLQQEFGRAKRQV